LICFLDRDINFSAFEESQIHQMYNPGMKIKELAARTLEQHPYGYLLGVFLLDNLPILLPHETDYWGFPLLAKKVLPAGSKTILDIGANRGHSSRAFLKLLPEWKVIAFEANPVHRDNLQKISLKHKERFSFHIGGVTDIPKGHLTLFTPYYKSFAMHSASALSNSEALAGVEHAFPSLRGQFIIKSTETSTFNIDSLNLECSFVKIDIQGEEFRALQGMSDTIKRCKPVILVEMNLTQHGISEFMQKNGYMPYTYDSSTNMMIHGYGPHTSEHRNQFFLTENHIQSL
jgi:FkbM family methyltransferase